MDNQKEQIIEYIRDELEGEEKESFERLLSKNAKIKQEYENMKNIWDLYEKLPQIEINESLYEKTLHSVKHYKSKSIKIRMFRTQDKIDLDRKKAARRLFTPVSAAAAVLILATVIITVIASDIAVRNINKNNKYLASDSMKYVIAEKISDNELKMEIPEKSKKSLMNSKSNYLIKSVPEESMDESKKRENSADDADFESMGKDSSRVLWPETKLSGKSKDFSDSIHEGNRGGANEPKDDKPGSAALDKNNNINRNKEMSEAIPSDFYVYFLENGSEMDVSLSKNQKLNLETELKDEILTRFDMAKYEIINELKSLSRNDRYIVILIEGLNASRIDKNGNRTDYSTFQTSYVLNNEVEVVNATAKELEKLTTREYNYDSDDILEVAKNRIDNISKIASHLKFYTAIAPANFDAEDSADEKASTGHAKSSVDVIDLSGSSNLEEWASNNNFSYSRR